MDPIFLIAVINVLCFLVCLAYMDRLDRIQIPVVGKLGRSLLAVFVLIGVVMTVLARTGVI